MKKITNKEKYRVLEKSDLQNLKDMNEEIKKSRFRQKFHIQPITGLLNDPNGFCFFDDEWHIFYQWFPFGAMHGAKNWYHMTSDDLVSWKNKGLALKPDTVFDNRGVYSGSAIIYDNKLNLIYTGNHKDERDIRHPYQCVAVLEDNEKFVKKDEPIINMSQDYTEHQRDPKIMYVDNKYYIILGAQDKNLKGRALIYVSDDIYNNWKLLGELKVKGYEDFGYMWECPDQFDLDGRQYLSISPQGLTPEEFRRQNVYQAGYFYQNEFYEWDYGFDFYAPQTFPAPDGRRILIGWMGLPDIDYQNPTVQLGWQHCLTVPRVLTALPDGRLAQYPAKELEALRQAAGHVAAGTETETTLPFDLEAETAGDFTLTIERQLVMEYAAGVFRLRFADPALGGGRESRQLKLERCRKIRILADTSSLEIYLNGGEAVLSTRFYPLADKVSLSLTGLSGRLYEMKGLTFIKI